MKKINLYLIALIAFSSLAGCKKFLDTKSDSQYTPDIVFSSPSMVNFELNGIYSLLTQDQMYSARLSLNYATNNDIEFVGADENSYSEDKNRGLSNYMGTRNNTVIYNEWVTLYRLIERANLLIDGVAKSPLLTTSDSTTVKGYLGEAYTLRALAFYELVKNWGDVPFSTEPAKPDLSTVYMGPTDRDTIYDHIIADLQLAQNIVPWVGEGAGYTPEKITKGFVKGLLARICLSRGGYSIRNKPGYPTERGSDWQKYYRIADTACREIIASGRHNLNPSYTDIWKNLCQLTIDNGSRENLFEAAMGLGYSGEMGYSIGVRSYTNGKYGFGNNANVVNTSPVYFYSFDTTDTRRDVTVAYYSYGNSSGDKKEFFQSNPLSYTIGKWDQRWMNGGFLSMNLAAQSKFGYGINWVLMRYSDVLLMFAEVENDLNGGPTNEAKQALKQVRSRAFGPSKQSEKVDGYVNGLSGQAAFFNAIVNERAWEFGGEAIRKYDLIRWNLLSSKIQELRDNFSKMLSRQAPYDKLPQYLFYKYNADNETIDRAGINFYTDKGAADIAGYTKINWLSGYKDADKASYLNRMNLFSSGLNNNSAGVRNRHLYPLHGSVISNSNGKLVNAYGF
ncbi:RagB/SusD family nutrient uptake outer membrane protein [Pinibacter soli]|uniref:RagB/SusD family nutrient uptake outer membrane protein n=1 Tax=Pinibacter soli TaxID=3044211 RepID=A0ABT6RGY3_9BACT|nr:RagB/SusD family nutrient uptake outer membrane protein [Pinibacter soli]MDI3321119.1 RagB/SusD family nutrient uptake outer membrane protein [Pinibacter soli]